MCEICLQYICPSGCPNAPEPPHIHCDLCDIEIYEGDCCYDINDMTICESCMEKDYERIYNSESDKQ